MPAAAAAAAAEEVEEVVEEVVVVAAVVAAAEVAAAEAVREEAHAADPAVEDAAVDADNEWRSARSSVVCCSALHYDARVGIAAAVLNTIVLCYVMTVSDSLTGLTRAVNYKNCNSSPALSLPHQARVVW